MKTALTLRLRDDRKRYSLHHTCEDCVYFDPTTPRCTHGYPTETHVRAAFEQDAGEAMFCKEFEIV